MTCPISDLAILLIVTFGSAVYLLNHVITCYDVYWPLIDLVKHYVCAVIRYKEAGLIETKENKNSNAQMVIF